MSDFNTPLRQGFGPPRDRWWTAPRLRDGLLVALAQVNEARAHNRRRPGWELEACSDYYRALNQLANSLDSTLPPPDPSPDRPDQPGRRTETVKLQKLMGGIPADQILGDPSVAAFAHFDPLVLDHGSAGMTQRIADLTDEVMHAASRQHREFRDSWLRWDQRGSGAGQVVNKLIRAILVVRNNLQHGEKTRSGPDLQRRERNQAVGRVILPILETLIDAVLDRPSQRLAAYGTLRPGQPNEEIITVAGDWSEVTLTGWLRDESGLPAFESDLAGAEVRAALLTTPELPKIWERLDEFEGENYRRRLGLYRHGDVIGVANVYEWTGGEW